MNMGAMNNMFQNPAFQKMASSLMENPEFKQKMDDMMKNETLMKEYAKIGEQIMSGAGGLPGMPGGAPGTVGDLGKDGAAAGAGGGIPGFGAGNAAFEQLQGAAQNMMKDYLKPEKLTELAARLTSPHLTPPSSSSCSFSPPPPPPPPSISRLTSTKACMHARNKSE
jgi:hypothetical protein